MDQELHLTEQEIVRRNKMEDLRAKGIDPFGQKFERTATSGSLKKEFLDKTKEELLELNIIGVGEKHKKVDDFLGNFVAISVGDSIFRLQNDYFEGKKVKISTHCGLCKEEMEVPIIVLECK